MDRHGGLDGLGGHGGLGKGSRGSDPILPQWGESDGFCLSYVAWRRNILYLSDRYQNDAWGDNFARL